MITGEHPLQALPRRRLNARKFSGPTGVAPAYRLLGHSPHHPAGARHVVAQDMGVTNLLRRKKRLGTTAQDQFLGIHPAIRALMAKAAEPLFTALDADGDGVLLPLADSRHTCT